MYCFCLFGLCEGQHSLAFKMYQLSSALSLVLLAVMLICNLFIGFKQKTFTKLIYDFEFSIYGIYIILKGFLILLKITKIKHLIESLGEKLFGWDAENYLEMRRKNYERNISLIMKLVIFNGLGLTCYITLPLFKQDEFPLFVTIPVNFDAYNGGLFWAVFLFVLSLHLCVYI